MAYQYQRTASRDLRSLLHLPAAVDGNLTDAYINLHALKASLDDMQEIPQDLLPFYRQIMKAIDALAPVQKEAYQLKMMARKIPTR